jgi:hypothetical protein
MLINVYDRNNRKNRDATYSVPGAKARDTALALYLAACRAEKRAFEAWEKVAAVATAKGLSMRRWLAATAAAFKVGVTLRTASGRLWTPTERSAPNGRASDSWAHKPQVSGVTVGLATRA